MKNSTKILLLIAALITLSSFGYILGTKGYGSPDPLDEDSCAIAEKVIRQ